MLFDLSRLRRGLRRRLRRATAQPIILMYHRIANPEVDPWGLAVQSHHFGEHLAVLRRSRRPFPMTEFVGNLERRTLPHNAVAVTFDDGYVDNVREAKPQLAAAGIPATLFVASGAISQRTEYWWDELARAILARREPLDCELSIAGEPLRLELPDVHEAHGWDRSWRAWEEPRNERETAYVAMWRRLRDLPADEREQAMRRLRQLQGSPPADPMGLPMTEDELSRFASNELFEVGGHTVNHPALTKLDSAVRRHEMLAGKQACERIAGKPVHGFAYPYGMYDAGAQADVRACGFKWACSTEGRPVQTGDYDLYALPRLCVTDMDGDAFESALRVVSDAAYA